MCLLCIFRGVILDMQRETEREKQNTRVIVKSGIACTFLMDMDDSTFRRHLRLTRLQFGQLNSKLLELYRNCAASRNDEGQKKVTMEMKTAMFLWYMANQNSFQEIGDKFNVAQSTAHGIVV